MKKYIITTGIALLALSSVYAENREVHTTQPGRMGRPMMATSTRPAMRTEGSISAQMMSPSITTGDATTDAAIKALQIEMEAKIKAIRQEYQVKIKALIGDKNVTINNGDSMVITGSATMRGDDHERMMRGSSTMMNHDERMRASTTHDGEMMDRQMIHQEGKTSDGQGVSNGSTKTEGGHAPQAQGGVRGFFGRLFGR